MNKTKTKTQANTTQFTQEHIPPSYKTSTARWISLVKKPWTAMLMSRCLLSSTPVPSNNITVKPILQIILKWKGWSFIIKHYLDSVRYFSSCNCGHLWPLPPSHFHGVIDLRWEKVIHGTVTARCFLEIKVNNSLSNPITLQRTESHKCVKYSNKYLMSRQSGPLNSLLVQ